MVQLLGVLLILQGVLVAVSQPGMPDFPNGFILFPPGFYLLLLGVQPKQRNAVRYCTLLICLVIGIVQFGHMASFFKPFKKAKCHRSPSCLSLLDYCDQHPGLTCARTALHILVAEVIGLSLFYFACPCPRKDQSEGFRHMWRVSRFAFGMIGMNVILPILLNGCSTLDVPDDVFGYGMAFGFWSYPSPSQHDACFVLTGLVWVSSTLVVAPQRRNLLRARLGLPTVGADDKGTALV